MPQFQTIKSVFNGGEMSPLMDGRTDSEKYATGCRVLENFIVRSYGGAFKRPGTRFGVFNDDVISCVRLIPFRRSTEVNFALGFKANEIKIWSYESGTFVTNAFTLVATLATTYSNAEIAALHYCQLNDIMHLTVATKHPKIITRANDGTWSFTDVPFQFAPALDPPSDLVTMTLEYDANDWVTATSYSVGNFVLYLNDLYRCKTANSDVTFTAAKWDKAVYQKPWNVDTDYVAGDVTEYFGSNYFCITAHTATSANRPGTGAQWVLITITDYRLIASAATFDANEVGSTWLLSPGSSGRITTEPIATAPATTTTAAIFIQGAYVARTSWAIGASPSGTIIQLQESLDRINFTNIREWSVGGQLEGAISYTGEAPNTGGWYRMVAIRTGTNANAARMTIDPVSGKLEIPFQIQSYVSTTQVRGVAKLAVDSLIPNEVLGFAFPVWRKGAFSVTRGFPRTVAFHDNRLWFAGTELYPTRIWASQIDDFYTFLTGSLDTSGIDITLAATEANDIQWISSFKRTLVVGTAGEEWTLDSGEQDTVMTPSNTRARRWSRYGSNSLQPVLVGDGLLWLTRDNRLREFAYVFEKDGYSSPEMTLLAEHIPGLSDVKQIAYSQSPDPIVWLVHTNGTWSGFTYDRENNITAWHRHNSNGKCMSICTLYSSSTASDALIFLFQRNYTESTTTLEHIEGEIMKAAMCSGDADFSESAFVNNELIFMDSYVNVTGTVSGGVTTFDVESQNPTLKLKDVVFTRQQILLNDDGSPLTVKVNSSGDAIVTGSYPVDYKIGIPFTAWLIPNRVEIQLQDGSAQMRKWRITRAAFRVWQSLYGNINQYITYPVGQGATADFSNYTAIQYDGMSRFPYYPTYGSTINSFVYTGQTLPQALNFDWGNALDIVIASRHPAPFNILAMILEVEVEGTSGAGT
jgi:hypothetical protein